MQQRIFEGVQAESIQTRDINQTINLGGMLSGGCRYLILIRFRLVEMWGSGLAAGAGRGSWFCG